MGAGKTTVGKTLAKHLNKTFYDADHEIEKRTGVNIPLIFELEGEEGFRRREAAVIEDLAKDENIVLATGGGAILLPDNRQHLKNNGIVIYLRANVHELYVRTKNDRGRPLLQVEDPLARLEALYQQRNPLYQETAHLIVDTGSQPVSHIIQQIERHLAQLDPPIQTTNESAQP